MGENYVCAVSHNGAGIARSHADLDHVNLALGGCKGVDVRDVVILRNDWPEKGMVVQRT